VTRCASSPRSRREGTSRTALGLAAALALACTGVAAAAPEVFDVEPELSSTEFTVTQLGFLSQRGRFGRTQGRIVLDAEGHTGSVEFVVDASSIDTGWGPRDAWLRGADMFDVAHYPMMRFSSTRLVFEQTRLVGISGLLTLRGRTRPVVLKIERMRCDPGTEGAPEGCGADAVSTIRRSDFGIGYAPGLVGDEVKLSLQVKAYRVQP
jgi:polyisoprenoid-binding protein YceI